jgi:hypothetical protein
MGILDEAIRNHLDLKRRHGAAEDDLKRLEDEAFGPPTRPGEPDFPEQEANGEPEAGDVHAEAPRAEELPVAEHGTAEPETADEPVADERSGFFDQAGDELSLADLDLELDEEEARVEEELAAELDEDEFAELGEPEAPRDRPEPEAAIESLPTEEHPVELDPDEADPEDEDEDEDDEDEDEDEDVLADTPEFLRDAPEDDELWFEQGKPKDFDFDEE